jgi:hypothetical protein
MGIQNGVFVTDGKRSGRNVPGLFFSIDEEKDQMTKPMKMDAMPKGMALGATEEVIAACRAWLEEAGVPVGWRALAAHTEIYPERNAWYLEEIVHLAGAIPMIGIGVADAYAVVIVRYSGGSYVLDAAGASLDEAIETLYQRVYDCLYGRKASSPALCSLESEQTRKKQPDRARTPKASETGSCGSRSTSLRRVDP